MLADALGTTVPGVLASIGNPIFGATAIYAQIYQASLQQYMAEKPEATREQAQKFANDQALAQVPWAIAGNQLTARALKASFATLPAGAVERGARIFGTQVGQAVAKNAQAFVGNVGSAIGQSMMSDMVSEDYDLLEDTDIGQKFTRSLEPASLAGGVSLIFGGAGLAGALAKRPGAKPKAQPAPPEVSRGEITLKALPAPKEAAPKAEAPAVAEPVAAEWIVQHASPHSFERFALASIGTGEGHQAFGRGLYFSEGVSTHKSYVEQFGGEGKAVSYKVKINANKDHFIDWDKPISEQGEFVKDKLKAAGILDPDGTLSFKVVTPNEKARSAKMPVSEFMRVQLPYADMTAIKMAAGLSLRSPDYPINSPQGAAEFLNSIGIKGIRYLDAASRGKEEGTRNIVIFDENIVEILEKNGKPVAPSKPIQKTLPAPEAGTELGRYGPLAPGETRPAYKPTGALPPSTSLGFPRPPSGEKPYITVEPLWQNPFSRKVIKMTPGDRESFQKNQSPIKNWRAFFIGTSEVFERAPGFEPLGQAIRDYVDEGARIPAENFTPFRNWEKSVTVQQKDQGLHEFYQFFLQSQDPDVNVQKKAIPTYWSASEKGRELIDQARSLFDRTGSELQGLGLKVFDPAINDWRPIGRIAGGGDPIPPAWYPGWKPGYFPRMIPPEHMEIIRNPKSDPRAYEKLKDMVEGMGYPRDSIDQYIANVSHAATNNEYFASLDMARTAKLPHTLYDYSFESVRRYIMAHGERLSQIKAFRQKTAFTGPESRNLFDDFKRPNINTDDFTDWYVKHVENQIFNTHIAPDTLAKFTRPLGTILTGVHLGNPVTASRNLASGQASIGTVYGNKHWLAGIEESFKSIDEAYEKGIIIDDLMNLMADSDRLGGQRGIPEKVTGVLLKYSGEMPAENFNRVVNMAAAKSLLRESLEEYATNPFSKRSLNFFGYVKRMGGIDPQALIDEGGSGRLTDRYLRQSVRYVQGGYRIDQTPAFQNTENARFFFKYSKWGTQHMNLFDKEVVRPAMRELRLGAKETVSVRDPKTGKMREVPVPGDLSKAVRYFYMLAGAGMGAAAFAYYALGIEDRTESWTEILHKMDKNKQEAFGDVLAKIFQYQLIMGVGGYLSNVAQVGFDWTQKVRQKDPMNPPIMELIRDTTQLFNDAMANGGVPTFRDFDEYLRRNSSQYRSAKQFGAYYGNDVFPMGFRELKRESMLQDLKWLRTVTGRYEKVHNISAASPWRPGASTKTEMTRFNYDLKEALLLGDVREAKRLIAARERGKTQKELDILRDSMMDSVHDGRPIKIGGSTSEVATTGFLQWADKNLSKADSAKLRRMDKTYTDTAVAAGVLEPAGKHKKRKQQSYEEWLEGQQVRTKLREQE